MRIICPENPDLHDEEVVVDRQSVAKLAGEYSATSTSASNSIMPLCNSLEKHGIEDMCTLNHLHEPAVLHNLETRFGEKHPYSYTGPICIAVNPYQWLDLYGKDRSEAYMKNTDSRAKLPPHPFALSSSAYQDMIHHRREQSILVSGESGSGKTETVKIMMNHLASVSEGGVEDSGSIIDKILKSNPLLESFGNATTTRNDNSSRFGKFAQLEFDAANHLIGARCATYLLEKSRVVSQAAGERNYHIFYQLLSQDEAERAANYRLPGDICDYAYVTSGRRFLDVDGKSDRVMYQETKDAMDTIGIHAQEQHGIFQIVAGILNLGQIQFTSTTSTTSEDKTTTIHENSTTALDSFATLLHTDAKDMENILCNRSLTAGTESYTIPLDCEQAQDLRDAFAKGIYAHMFDWLVSRVNSAIHSNQSSIKSHIGLLDIFGFESFENNYFEQLCINYANEKLQQKFNHDVFKSVQVEYEQEGIPLNLVSYEDNQKILDLIEGKLGMIDLINEEVVRPKGTDEAFVSKMLDLHSGHPHLEQSKFDKMNFQVLHYAGEVVYNGTGFLEKNKDTLPTDLVTLLSSSSSPLIQQIFAGEQTSSLKTKSAKHQGYLVGKTIAGAFRKQLSGLMGTISKTEVQYVRCVKPNGNKRATEFDRQMVVDQLRYAGMIAAIRISREAFPNRIQLTEFQRRFDILCPSAFKQAPVQEMVAEVLKIYIPNASNSDSTQNELYAIGKTKIYFSSGQLQKLEELRNNHLRGQGILIQKSIRAWVARKKFLRTIMAYARLQANVRGKMQSRSFQKAKKGAIYLQAHARGSQARRAYAEKLKIELAKRVAQKEQQAKAETEAAAAETATAATAAHASASPSPASPSRNSDLSSAASKVAAAESAAREAQSAAAAAAALNKELRNENESLKSKLSSGMAEHADEELVRENDRLKQQIASLQGQLVRAQEVSLVTASVVDSRITYREGRQFVEYKLQIETNTRGTLFVWHRYSTFRNLASTLQSKNGFKRKDIPELPSKQLFGNFSEKVIQERVERLNMFLDAATKADYLQWGIRVDQDTCVYKRRVKSSSSSGGSRGSMTGRDSLRLSESSERQSMSGKSRFSFRWSQTGSQVA